MPRTSELWLNSDPVTKNHVKIMDVTYEGSLNKREMFSYFLHDVEPIKQWIKQHQMDTRCRFDYRAVKDQRNDFTKVYWYLLFDTEEDRVLYTLCQDDLLNGIIEGIM